MNLTLYSQNLLVRKFKHFTKHKTIRCIRRLSTLVLEISVNVLFCSVPKSACLHSDTLQLFSADWYCVTTEHSEHRFTDRRPDPPWKQLKRILVNYKSHPPFWVASLSLLRRFCCSLIFPVSQCEFLLIYRIFCIKTHTICIQNNRQEQHAMSYFFLSFNLCPLGQ